MRNPRRSIFLVFTFFMLAAVLAWASITGGISGVVTDPSGAVVSGATVVAEAETHNTPALESEIGISIPEESLFYFDDQGRNLFGMPV